MALPTDSRETTNSELDFKLFFDVVGFNVFKDRARGTWGLRLLFFYRSSLRQEVGLSLELVLKDSRSECGTNILLFSLVFKGKFRETDRGLHPFHGPGRICISEGR